MRKHNGHMVTGVSFTGAYLLAGIGACTCPACRVKNCDSANDAIIKRIPNVVLDYWQQSGDDQFRQEYPQFKG